MQLPYFLSLMAQLEIFAGGGSDSSITPPPGKKNSSDLDKLQDPPNLDWRGLKPSPASLVPAPLVAPLNKLKYSITCTGR